MDELVGEDVLEQLEEVVGVTEELLDVTPAEEDELDWLELELLAVEDELDDPLLVLLA